MLIFLTIISAFGWVNGQYNPSSVYGAPGGQYRSPVSAPAPIYNAPAATYSPPAPVYKSPVGNAPAPTYSPPAPVYKSPVENALAPTYSPPAAVYKSPVGNAPAPTYSPPAPVYKSPAVPSPTYSPPGGALSPTEGAGPSPVEGAGPSPTEGAGPSPLEESDLKGNEIVLPTNTKLSLRDKTGQYSHGFSDKEGTTISEQGRLISTNEGWEYVLVKKGSYAYTSPEGKRITVNYIADQNGFRVLGDEIS